ncbi:MAG: response regulator [Candidatus Cloacimonadales bacterium]
MSKQKKIIIVEDEVIIAECLAMELQIAGYEILGNFTTGLEAIAAAQESKPDVILMDIHLSGNLNGIAAAEKIRTSSDCLIIFMTGFDKGDIMAQCQHLANVAFLEKPVETYQVEEIITKL